MPRQRAHPSTGGGTPNRPVIWWSLALATAAVIGVVIFMMGNGDGTLVGSGDCEPVDGIDHVHGLAVSPDNGSVVYAATHHGLFRVTGDETCRLGPVADYMGFTMHPSDGGTFWVSGHPGSASDRMDLGNNMGVLKSTDGGHSWEQIALKGVDFHSMTVSQADPDRLWGEYQGQVYRSDDGGHDWKTIGSSPAPFRALSGHAEDRDIVYAAVPSGLLVSTDGGSLWETLTDRPAGTVTAHPEDGDLLFAVFEDGLHRSSHAGQTWDRLDLDTGQALPAHVAISSSEPDLVYAATGAGAIHRSTDQGDTWERIA